MNSSRWEYQDLFELAPVMIASIDPSSGQILECNQQVLSSLGYSKPELLSKTFLELCSSESAPRARDALGRLADGESFVEQDLAIQRQDRSFIDVWLRAAAIHDEARGTIYANCVWQDISQRKRAELELRESRRQLQAILDHASAAIYVKDLRGKYALVNRRFAELVDVPTEDVCGKTDYQIFPEKSARAFRANDLAVLERNRPTTFEETTSHGEQQHTYISVKFPLQDDRGETYAIGGISTDITRRKEVEAALHESEERFRQLADNLQDCFWVAEVRTWKVLYVSPAYEQIWGRPRANLYEDSGLWIKCIHDADRLRVSRSFAQDVIQGEYDEEFRIVRPDGTIRWVHDRGVPIRDHRGIVFRVAGIAQDITERKQLQKQVSDVSAREQRRISQEIHDELGQQLTGLSFLAKSLEKRLGDLSMEEARDASALADGIQNAIREVRRSVHGLAPVDLDEHGIRVALEQLAETTTERSSIACTFSCAFQVSIRDNTVATHLYRIAQEAINNAVKYSQAEHIDVSLGGHDGTILLRIRDDGIGLPANREAEDGMGLQIMRHRASLIGANLEVTSAEDTGTEIVCILRRETDGGKSSK